MISKYTIGSKIHQALCKLENLAMDPLTLRKSIDFKESTNIFDLHIIQPLVNDRMISRVDTIYKITPVGISRLDNMGRFVKKKLQRKEKVVWTTYTHKEVEAVRPHADDHFKWASRRGNQLFYRDGRVANV
jgi:hypothetical protein